MLRTILRNNLYLLSGEGFAKLLSFIFTVAAARILGAAGFGEYSFILYYVFLFEMMMDLGLSRLLIREVARDKEKTAKYLANVAVVKIALSVVVLALMVGLVKKELIFITGLYLIFRSFNELMRSVFLGWEEMRFEALFKVTERSLIYGLGFLVLVTTLDLKALLGAFLTGAVLSFLIGYSFIRSRLDISGAAKYDLSFIKRTLKEVLPLGLALIMTSAYCRLPLVTLSFIKGSQASGYYSSAYNLIFHLPVVAFLFAQSVYPALSRKVKDNPAEARRLFWGSLGYCSVLGLGASVGVFFGAAPLITKLYGGEYLPAIGVLKILSGGLFFVFMSNLVNYGLIAFNRIGHLARAASLALMTNAALNIILINRFSYHGAAYSAVITEVVFFAAVITPSLRGEAEADDRHCEAEALPRPTTVIARPRLCRGRRPSLRGRGFAEAEAISLKCEASP